MESISMGDEPSYSTGELADDDDDDEEQVVVAGGGRLYKCIFCKRGFTTAQALGGHMNIHRKDRAKGRRPLNINNNDHLMSNRISSKIEDHSSACYAGPRSYHQPVFASYTPSYTSYQEGFAGNYTTYFSSTSSTAVGARNQENSINNHQEDIVDHEVIRNPSSLRLQFGCSYDQNPKRTIDRSGNEEHELDLELRLGYDP